MMRHSPKAQGAYNEEQNCEENVQKSINQLGNKYVLSAFLKAFTETDYLMWTGMLFHNFEAQTVKLLSPAWTRVLG